MSSFTSMIEGGLWNPSSYDENTPRHQRIANAYAHVRNVGLQSGITIKDVRDLSSKYWKVFSDFIVTSDVALNVILNSHWTLCMGTIAPFAPKRPELQRILQKLERFEVLGGYLLTEVGHGLDARNIETTATLNPDGSFDLHSPTPSSGKSMPPTTPLCGIPRVGIVYSQLIVEGERRGIRPFLVHLSEGGRMAPGVTNRMMPPQSITKTTDYSITTFNHVRLEAPYMLGELEKPQDARKDFFRQIHRIPVGTLSLSMIVIPCLKLSSYILGKYSQQRQIAATNQNQTMPVIEFSTQHTPVLMGIAYAMVMEELAKVASKAFTETKNPTERDIIACIFKNFAMQSGPSLILEMVDRCGWRGIFSSNQIIDQLLVQRGNAIADGDVLVLCIRLVSEVLLGRYTVPAPKDPGSLLARHEAGIWADAAKLLKNTGAVNSSHRGNSFNTFILPRSREIVLATGQRMAYESAQAANVNPEILELFEASCILNDASWYVENIGLSCIEIKQKHAKAVQNLFPRLDQLLHETQAQPWAHAPILSQKRWEEFQNKLPQLCGDYDVDNAFYSKL